MTSASIQKIIDIQPIPDADKIEVATVLGWKVVVQKGLHQIGDYIIYVEIDSITPDTKYYEFLRDRNFRVRTIKLRGQISQGLILSLSVLLSVAAHVEDITGDYIKEGQDVSDILGIKHYEKPLSLELSGIAIGQFPGFLHKTDEVMIQSELHLLDELWGKPYYITIKIDGMSGTFYKTIDGKYGVCSRNLELKEHENNVFWKLSHKYSLDTIKPGIYVQGEIAGPGIQKNRMGLSEVELFIFNIKQIEGDKPLTFTQALNSIKLGYVKMVPLVMSGDSFNMTLDQLILFARDDIKYENGTPAEGIVVRSQDGLISFKVMNNNYLLKNGE